MLFQILIVLSYQFDSAYLLMSFDNIGDEGSTFIILMFFSNVTDCNRIKLWRLDMT